MNIIWCSKIYGDEKHFELQETLDKNNEFTLKCHKSCVSSYTSKTHTERHKRQRAGETDSNVPRKVTRRSQSGDSAEPSGFQNHCVFCVEFCNLKNDKKNPSRWRAAFLFRELETKKSLLEVCGKGNDDVVKSVQHRLEGALSDLHAVDARYHVARRNAGDADVTVIDGSALLWTIHWPADGTIADFIENVKTRLTSYLSDSDVDLIFDRDYDYSIKSVTRDARETGVSKKHHLLLSTKVPAQKVVLSSIENKKIADPIIM